MLRAPNSSREDLEKIELPKWDDQSFNSSRKMARFYFNEVTVPSSQKTYSKNKIKKKLLFKEQKKAHPLPFNETLFFQNHLCGIENRTVNSLADTDDLDKSDSEKPRRKKRRPKYIDSEVDLMINTLDNRPRIKLTDVQKHSSTYQNLVANKRAMQQQLQLQQQQQFNDAIEKDASKKKLVKARGTMVSSIPIGKSSPKKRKLQQETAVNENTLFLAKYPILMDKELVHKFLTVEMTNNQKGRLRQIMKEIVRGTTTNELPDVLNNKIQAILRSSAELTDTDLRKIRILYNMLKKATLGEAGKKAISTTKEGNKVIEDKTAAPPIPAEKKVEEKPAVRKEKKHKKRYVVFVGNLPTTIIKEEILQLFSEIQNDILDIRIPKLPDDGSKSAIAYVELRSRHSYEIALSKHHWMMGKRRINVLYTTHNNSKLTSAEIKAKQAKLLALQKKGKLIGSMSLNKKRSQRRAKQRKANSDKAKKESSKLIRVTDYTTEG